MIITWSINGSLDICDIFIIHVDFDAFWWTLDQFCHFLHYPSQDLWGQVFNVARLERGRIQINIYILQDQQHASHLEWEILEAICMISASLMMQHVFYRFLLNLHELPSPTNTFTFKFTHHLKLYLPYLLLFIFNSIGQSVICIDSILKAFYPLCLLSLI